MKAKKFILICNLLICNLQFSQNIISTLGVSGQFSIKDGSTTYLSLSQSTGYLSLNRSLTLSNTSGSNVGVIYKGANRFIHNYQPVSSFGENTFVGVNSGNFTMSGSGNQSSYNTGVGMFSLFTNTTGYKNTALGHGSLSYNTTGYNNTAVGQSSMVLYTTGHDNTAVGFESLAGQINSNGIQNTAVGSQSLYSNTGGDLNCAFGVQPLYSNTSGNGNSAFGNLSLYSNTDGFDNSAFGMNSLFSNSGGTNNTAIGNRSLLYNSTGSFNTAVGNLAGFYLTSGSNNTIIGQDAQVPSSTANNQVRIGNTDITYAGIQVAWTITSDRKWKENIITSPLGLKFISRLNPVSYIRKNDESKKAEYGLIAQEVEEVLKDEGAENSAMITVTENGDYELRYNDLLAPMIKAIQELNDENAKLKNEIGELKFLINEIKNLKLSNSLRGDLK